MRMTPRSFLTALAIYPTLLVNEANGFTSCVYGSGIPQSLTAMFLTQNSRRIILQGVAALTAGTFPAVTQNVYALDFDAFEKGQIAADTENCNPKLDSKCQPKLSADEALCQYGNSGKARGEACKRVRDSGGKLPEVKKEKSLGGAYAM